MSGTEYSFDWRAEPERDGWLLQPSGMWRHLATGAERPDASSVYVGSGVWVETWPHQPDRRASHRMRPPAVDLS